jgi:hypothetical protein
MRVTPKEKLDAMVTVLLPVALGEDVGLWNRGCAVKTVL